MSIGLDSIAPLSGTWHAYRHVGGGWAPLWLPESSRCPTNQDPGRWNREGGAPAQYLSLSIAGSWCELIHGDEIKRTADLDELSVELWELKVVENRIADLSTFAKAAAAGIDPPILVAQEHEACRRLRDELERAGFRGVLSPSAAIVTRAPLLGDRDHLNLTLFGARRAWPPEFENPDPNYFVTACQAARGARPPADLLKIVRYPGDPCLDLETWRRQFASSRPA